MSVGRRAHGGERSSGHRGEFLFQTRYGNPLNRDKLREKVIRSALREAGLPETFRTYDLRHSHASVVIDLGVNLLALAQRMGHSDPAMTLRLYGHLFEGTQVQLSEKIDELRAATEPKGRPSPRTEPSCNSGQGQTSRRKPRCRGAVCVSMHVRHVDDVDELSVEHSAIEHGDAVSGGVSA